MHSKWNQKYRKQCAPTQRPDVWLSAALRLAEKTKTKQTLQDRNKAKNQHHIEGEKKKKKAGKKLGKKIQSTVTMLVVETQYPVRQIFTDAEQNTKCN